MCPRADAGLLDRFLRGDAIASAAGAGGGGSGSN